MKPNVDILEKSVVLYDEINKLKDLLRNASKPMIGDLSILPNIHKYIRERVSLKKREAVRCELFILIYLYNPMMLVSSRGRGEAIMAIAKAVGMTYHNLAKYKPSLLQRYKLYKDFRDAVNDMYNDVCCEFSEYLLV